MSAKVTNYQTIKYNVVMCYDKILANVAAYIISVITRAATFTKILSQHITILYFIILIICNFS
jgi:hypothetical protein